MSVPDLLLGLPAGPPDEGARSGLGQALADFGRAGRLVLLGGGTRRPAAALARRDVRAGSTFQAAGIFGISRKYPRQRQKRTEYFLDVDVVLCGALEDLHPAEKGGVNGDVANM